ncbi:DUF4307 domain-containing protein [Amnibacterium endophyticum]|uniref:DUF4307 domain-containing protein n=1 Tax=Amnibacterium endophyticum TaxID=2109337 RepID=A0ABW4LE73_9MICO
MSNALDVRYGRTPERRRRGRVVAIAAGGAVALAAAAWGVWTGIGGSTSTYEADTVTSRVIDDHSTEVRWLITGRADAAFVCAIEARDTSGITVGLVEQTVPVTGSGNRAGDTVVRTVRKAATGLIASCRDA